MSRPTSSTVGSTVNKGNLGRRLLRLLIRNWTGSLGLLLFAVIAVAVLLAPWLSPYDPAEQAILSRLSGPAWFGAESDFPLGSDSLGRDILSRMLYGGRISLMVGLVAVVISGIIGVSLGLLAGYFRGPLESLVMRIADIQLAVPTLILALTVMAIFGSSLRNVILVLGITGWVVYARVVRSEVLSVREQEYVLAARALGNSDLRNILWHVFPNVAASIIVISSLRLGTMILLEATLSFLGLGIQPPTPTWGGMIATGRDLVYSAWWVSVFPGVALSLTVISVNLFGDWLRDVLDPRLQL